MFHPLSARSSNRKTRRIHTTLTIIRCLANRQTHDTVTRIILRRRSFLIASTVATLTQKTGHPVGVGYFPDLYRSSFAALVSFLNGHFYSLATRDRADITRLIPIRSPLLYPRCSTALERPRVLVDDDGTAECVRFHRFVHLSFRRVRIFMDTTK